MPNLSEISVAILAGGFGRRLRSKLPNTQKVLAKVGKYPFLEYLLNQLDKAGFKDVVICTGYKGWQVQKQFGKKFKHLSLHYSQEKYKLDTAGAIRLALPHLKSDNILVTNGDSFFDTDLRKFYQTHFKKRSKGTILLTEVSDTSRHGSVKIDKKERIVTFQEKKKNNKGGLINAGIYLLKRSLLFEIPEKRSVSLEKEMFSKWIGKDFYGFQGKGKFIDIGIPNDYVNAEKFFTRRFVILDRDGTIITERNYLSDHSQVELIPEAAKGLKKIKALGLGLVVITNQSGIGRGFFSLKDLTLIHKKMISLLKKEGLKLDGIYFCPHKPDDNCTCRKPKLGLVKKAAKEHNFDPKECFVIGDKELDIELGQKMKANTFLVRTGYGSKVEKESLVEPDCIVDDLLEAADIIQQQLRL